jgi:predicted MFS family arabinose efflux permease
VKSPAKLFHALFDRFAMGYERRVMTFLLLVFVLDYADRALVGALGPTLKRVFHFGNGELGLLAAAFAIVGAIATIPFGMLTDHVKRTLLLAISLLVWAAAVGITGAAISFAMLFGTRLFLGVVAAVSGPTIPSLTGDLVPGGNRGRGFGYITTGQLIGEGIGFLLPLLVLGFLSFRWCFWILAVGGVALAVVFFRLREPERTGAAGPKSRPKAGEKDDDTGQDSRAKQIVQEKKIQPSERALLRRDPSDLSMWDAARYVLRVRTDVIVLVSRSIGDFFFAAISTFAVVFATDQYHISQREGDLAILVIGIGALAGVLLVGRIADALLAHGKLNSRVWLAAASFIIAPFALVPAFLTHSLLVALPFFIVGAFFLAGAGPPLDAVRIDVIVPRLRGRAESIRQVLRAFAEGGAPLLIGILADRLAGGGGAGLQLALLIVLPVVVLNGLILLIALRTYQPDVAAAVASTDRLTQRDQQAAGENASEK